MVLIPGLDFGPDVFLFASWARAFHDVGFARFYEVIDFCNYPPLTLLILWAVGQLTALFDPGLINEQLLRMVVKVPGCLADLAVAVLLYREATRITGRRAALGAAGLFFLNPVAIYQSAYWGQVDSIHAALLLAALGFIGRRRWGCTGAAAGLALAQKLQSIALLPLILFEVYRLGRWKASGRFAAGMVLVTAGAWAPFSVNGTLSEVLRRGYVGVVGQYPDLSRNAFNLWYLLGSPGIPDTSIPPPIARAAAKGQVEFPDDSSWLLMFTWRNISIAMFALLVAVILSLYARRPNVIARYGTAGLLALLFFLVPTEMHERYALPALVLLPIWAVTGPWKERLYFLVSILLGLNLAAVLAPGEIAMHIAAGQLLLFGAALSWLMLSETFGRVESHVAESGPIVAEAEAPPSLLIRWFQRATVTALGAALALVGVVVTLVVTAPPAPPDENVLYLSDLKPVEIKQGWGSLKLDRSVSGGLFHLGHTYYLRGLGTHATSRLRFDLPEGFDSIEAVVGVNRATAGNGSASISVELDGQVFAIPTVIRGASDPVKVQIPLEGRRTLVLRTDPTADGNQHDHVDWALARLVREPSAKSP
jgi:Gpi18-like mannosyltransferase